MRTSRPHQLLLYLVTCGHLGTLEPGSRSEGQLEPPGPCVQAPPPRVPPATPGGEAGGKVRDGGLDDIQVAPKALETWTELTHFPTPGKQPSGA